MRAKEELKKGLDAATRKAEREVKLAKDEAANFKTKLDDMEQKLTRVIKQFSSPPSFLCLRFQSNPIQHLWSDLKWTES